jgi:hypothetical protein
MSFLPTMSSTGNRALQRIKADPLAMHSRFTDAGLTTRLQAFAEALVGAIAAPSIQAAEEEYERLQDHAWPRLADERAFRA